MAGLQGQTRQLGLAWRKRGGAVEGPGDVGAVLQEDSV